MRCVLVCVRDTHTLCDLNLLNLVGVQVCLARVAQWFSSRSHKSVGPWIETRGGKRQNMLSLTEMSTRANAPVDLGSIPTRGEG